LSVTEAPRPVVFGEIGKEAMAREPAIIKLALPLIRDACKHSRGQFTYQTVFDGVSEGRFKLWGVFRPPSTLESVAITSVVGRVFSIFMVGPMVEPMFKHMPQLMSAAHAAQCERVRVEGLSSWRKWLREEDGWRQPVRVFERDVVR
jgi:hypothetical protein